MIFDGDQGHRVQGQNIQNFTKPACTSIYHVLRKRGDLPLFYLNAFCEKTECQIFFKLNRFHAYVVKMFLRRRKRGVTSLIFPTAS